MTHSPMRHESALAVIPCASIFASQRGHLSEGARPLENEEKAARVSRYPGARRACSLCLPSQLFARGDAWCFAPLGYLAPAANGHGEHNSHGNQYREGRCKEPRLRQALGLHLSAGQQPVLVTVPSGQVVLDQIAALRFA